MGSPDFRVGGRIFATLASQSMGYGKLMLTPELQADFVRELPEVFLAVSGGWARMGATHVRPANASDDVLTGALRTAWKVRVEKNGKTRDKKSKPRRLSIRLKAQFHTLGSFRGGRRPLPLVH